MSEPRKPRLPIPLGSILEERSLAPGREERLWAAVQKRRGAASMGHSEPPRAGTFLPAPLARTLDSADDLTNKRSRLWRQIQARRKESRSASAFRGAFALGFAVAACVSLLIFFRPELSQLAARQVDPSNGRALTLRDGGAVARFTAPAARRVVTLSDDSELRLDAGAELVPVRSTADRFELVLARGSAEFSVTPGGPRRWVIDAGLARVEVLGTVFRVERAEGRVRVSVTRGKVMVHGAGLPNGQAVLTVGQSVQVAAPVAAVRPAPAPEPLAIVDEVAPPQESAVALPEVQLAASPRARTRRSDAVEAPWHRHVKEGRFAEAYESLGREGFTREVSRAESPEALLSLADAARLSGHPAEAVAPLERVLSDFSTTPHAALSAFTLGRVLLDQLNAPAPAARAFEQAIAMHPPSALLADCHARLVEAYARSGDGDSARRAASRYRTLFPAGRHAVDAWNERND